MVKYKRRFFSVNIGLLCSVPYLIFAIFQIFLTLATWISNALPLKHSKSCLTNNSKFKLRLLDRILIWARESSIKSHLQHLCNRPSHYFRPILVIMFLMTLHYFEPVFKYQIRIYMYAVRWGGTNPGNRLARVCANMNFWRTFGGSHQKLLPM